MHRAIVPLVLASLLAAPAARAEKVSPKKVIAVSKFENKAQQWNEGGGWYNKGQIGDGMHSMLVEALVKTGKFIVVERGEGLNEIKAEQSLKKGGDSRGS